MLKNKKYIYIYIKKIKSTRLIYQTHDKNHETKFTTSEINDNKSWNSIFIKQNVIGYN